MFDATRMAILAHSVERILHDLNNPLNSLRCDLDYLEQKCGLSEDDPLATAFYDVQRSVEQICDITTSIRAFLRGEIDLAPMNLLAELDLNVDKKSGLVKLCPSLNLKIMGNIFCVAPSINYLLTNAERALENASEGVVTISARKENNHVHVLVQDNGPGIPEEFHDRLFEDSVTTKTDDSAPHGLGLKICRFMVESMDGSIKYLPHFSGAAFEITLKAAD